MERARWTATNPSGISATGGRGRAATLSGMTPSLAPVGELASRALATAGEEFTWDRMRCRRCMMMEVEIGG